MVGMLAGLLFMEGRQPVPHFVDENGNPFSLRFTPVRPQMISSNGGRSPLLRDGWSALDDRALVPIPAWSLPEVISGRAEADAIFMLEDEARFQTAPVGFPACGFHTVTAATDCSY